MAFESFSTQGFESRDTAGFESFLTGPLHKKYLEVIFMDQSHYGTFFFDSQFPFGIHWPHEPEYAADVSRFATARGPLVAHDIVARFGVVDFPIEDDKNKIDLIKPDTLPFPAGVTVIESPFRDTVTGKVTYTTPVGLAMLRTIADPTPLEEIDVIHLFYDVSGTMVSDDHFPALSNLKMALQNPPFNASSIIVLPVFANDPLERWVGKFADRADNIRSIELP